MNIMSSCLLIDGHVPYLRPLLMSHRAVVKARAVLCYVGVRKLGLTSVSVSKELGVSPSAVSKSIGRGQQALGNEAIEEYLLESQ